MSNSVSFKTRRPIALDQQIKTFGEHKNVPLTPEDAFRLAVAEVDEAVIVDDETGEETPLTLENYDTVDPTPNPFFNYGNKEEDSNIEPVDLVTFGVESKYNLLFLNGVAGRIYARKDGTTVLAAKNSIGKVVEYELDDKSVVFGGSKEASVSKTSVTVESGKVFAVYGGGLGSHTVSADADTTNVKVSGGASVKRVFGGGGYASHVKSSNVSVDDAIIENIYGGGDAGGVDDGTPVGTQKNPELSLCIVDKANVNIKKLSVGTAKYGVFFGGGKNYSYTKEVEMTIDDSDISTSYVTAGGANGRTYKATLTLNGGAYNVVQSINRGSMITAKVVVNGGTVANLYAGGEDPETCKNDVVNGFITDNGAINVEVNGGTVTALKTGSNGDKAIAADDKVVSVKVSSKAVVNNLEDAKVAFGSSLTVV